MNQKQWIFAAISTLLILLISGGIWWGLRTFYHPLTLIHHIDRQNVIGYLEWRKQDQEALFGDGNFSFPPALSKLNCELATCSFWGEHNALVMRKQDDDTFWEVYIDHPNHTILEASWASLTDAKNELLIGETRYHLIWQNEIAIFSPRSTIAAAENIDTMPWVNDGSWSIWGNFLAAGFCDQDCLWRNWQQMGSSFPLLADFVYDTITYSTFTIHNSPDGPQAQYQLNFSSTYHAAMGNKNKGQTSISFPIDAQLVFSGVDLGSMLHDLLHDNQNKGLWKTIVDFGAQTTVGTALEGISQVVSNYPYSVIVNKKWQNTQVKLVITEEADWEKIKDTINTQAQVVLPVLFPRKDVLTLPDGSKGFEWTKNNDLSLEWRNIDSTTNSAQCSLTIRNKRDNSTVLTLYVSIVDKHFVTLALQPIMSQPSVTCELPQAAQEFNAWHYDSNHWLWESISKQSLNNVQGTIGWTKSIPHCVQN